MIDIISLLIAIGAVLVALTTHIKFSKCWGFEMTTRSPKHTPPNSPHITETQPLLQDIPTIMEPTQPIDITNKRKVIKKWL